MSKTQHALDAAIMTASPAVLGIVGGAFAFVFLWPKSRKEGFFRLVTAGASSHFFGDGLLKTIVHFAEWIPPDDIRAGVYLLAGVPGWWILGAAMRYLQKTETQNIADVVKNWKD